MGIFNIDVTINELAEIINEDRVSVKHIHPYSEIMKLKCNYNKAKELMNWQIEYFLKEGIEETEQWIKGTKLLK